MDDNLKILLNSEKNINAVNIDSFKKIELGNNVTDLTEYNIYNIINATRVFDIERDLTEIYRIYGEIEYLSLFNGLDLNYQNFSDFFSPFNIDNAAGRTILNSFDFYLLRPSDEFEHISGNNYVRKFEVIATPYDIDIFPAGYSKNVFNEQKFAFNLSKDIDVSNYFDYFGFPCTELFLFPQFKPITNGTGNEEELYRTFYTENYNYTTELDYTTYNIGDLIYGDLILYNEENYSQTKVFDQIYYILTKCNFDGDINNVRWSYNPFIPLRLRYLSNEVNKVNTGTTIYDQSESIPTYATHVGGDNYVWRDILSQGFVDPITGEGVNYPFINKRRYLFENIKIKIIPDIKEHNNTKILFSNIEFNEPISLNKKPISDVNDINKPCQ